MKKKTLQSIVHEKNLLRQEVLDRHQAFETQTGDAFIGYIGKNADGRFFNDIYKNGVHHGKIYGPTIEDVKFEASEQYGEL